MLLSPKENKVQTSNDKNKTCQTTTKGRDQSNTKNVTNKTSRLHSVAKQHKVSERSVWNPNTRRLWTKSNKV